ncbi:hypothetical protein [Rhodococcus sp. HS-D2]|uniref:hypothetical protein n=1 Tax=Rhodococcus sp. HS-D2 TaxID=1384636 RepID=UPI000ABAD20B|nr:hypothetical protein [Rhodococcus sp. HS-D2]
MTLQGIIVKKYSEIVELRPFSLFTRVDEEQSANAQWKLRALEWGAMHIDEYGNVKRAA